MEALIYILISLVIGGLGSLAYKHPPVARKLLYPILGISIIIYFIVSSHSLIKISAYNEAYRATKTDIKLDIDKFLPTLHLNTKNKDSLNIARAISKCNGEKYIAVYQAKTLLSDSLANNIDLLIERNRKNTKPYLLYCFYSFVITVALIGLSFFFDNIFDKEKVTSDNKTK